MPKAHSEDLRQRIIDAWQAGEGKLSLSRRFLVSYASVKRYVRTWQQRGQVAAQPRGGGRPRAVDEAGEQVVRALVEQQPDLTDAELAERYRERTGKKASTSAVHRAVHRMGLTRKKSLSMPPSRTARRPST
jgi:transposase